MRYAILLLSTFSCAGALGQAPPEGWHAPTAESMRGQTLRTDSPTNFVRAEGDFDGDGETDRAARCRRNMRVDDLNGIESLDHIGPQCNGRTRLIA